MTPLEKTCILVLKAYRGLEREILFNVTFLEFLNYGIFTLFVNSRKCW